MPWSASVKVTSRSTPPAMMRPSWRTWVPRNQAAVGPLTERTYRSSPYGTTQIVRGLLSLPSARSEVIWSSSAPPTLVSSSLVQAATNLPPVTSRGTFLVPPPPRWAPGTRSLRRLPAERRDGALGDVPADHEGRGGGRGRRVQHVNHVLTLLDQEVIDERARPAEALRADPGRAERDVPRTDLGDVPAHLSQVGRLDQVAPDLQGAGTGVGPGQLAQAGEAQAVQQVPAVHRRAPAPLPAQRGRRVRAGVQRPDDAPGEVHAEERERRVGHRVNQPADQAGRGRPERVVVAAERDDPVLVAALAGHGGDPVGLEAGTGDHGPGPDRPRVGLGDPAAGAPAP